MFLLNAPTAPDEVWDDFPVEVRPRDLEKKLKFYAVNA